MAGLVDALPESFARSVRLAPLPLESRTLLRHLGPWTLAVVAPREPAAMPLALRQLLKLGLLPGADVMLVSVTMATHDDEVSADVGRGPRRLTLGPDALAQDLRLVVHTLAAELTDPADLVKVSEAFALELAREETVRTLWSRMLCAADLDEALHAMLLGITSGYGARFHRAALFTYDEASRVFRGSSGIGPRDEDEAHRIWEAIETEDKTLDQSLDDYRAEGSTGFQEFVRAMTVPEPGRVGDGAIAGDEVDAALAAGTPLRFMAPPRNPALAALLAPATEFVLSVIQPRGARLGLIVADNAYGRQPVVGAQLDFLRALVAPTSLVWDTRSLLRRVDALARHDPLTGLWNRRELDERLAVEQSRCARGGHPLSLAILDLDHFKHVNDTRGHGVGDVLLRRVGVLLAETLRQHDLPSRYGGDEFVLLLPEGTKGELVAVTSRIGKQAKNEGISLSVGGATWPDDSVDPSALFGVADAQLYLAKGSGRGCLCVPGAATTRF